MITLSSNYIKVGRIRQSIAKVAHIKAADIMIDNNHIRHIKKQHGIELGQIGLSPLNFVKMVCASFDRIYKDRKTNVLYLVIWDETITKTAVIGLNYIGKTGFWEIKTAAPFRTTVFKTKSSVWVKGAHPLK